MISEFFNSIFILLRGNNLEFYLGGLFRELGFYIPANSLLMVIFTTTFICFLFRIIYKFKCALFGKKKRKKER